MTTKPDTDFGSLMAMQLENLKRNIEVGIDTSESAGVTFATRPKTVDLDIPININGLPANDSDRVVGYLRTSIVLR